MSTVHFWQGLATGIFKAHLRAGVYLTELSHGDLTHADIDGISGPDIGLAIRAVLSHGNGLKLQDTVTDVDHRFSLQICVQTAGEQLAGQSANLQRCS